MNLVKARVGPINEDAALKNKYTNVFIEITFFVETEEGEKAIQEILFPWEIDTTEESLLDQVKAYIQQYQNIIRTKEQAGLDFKTRAETFAQKYANSEIVI